VKPPETCGTSLQNGALVVFDLDKFVGIVQSEGEKVEHKVDGTDEGALTWELMPQFFTQSIHRRNEARVIPRIPCFISREISDINIH
jgi:hypothetical protein